MNFIIRGHLPTKKNRWKRRKGGGMFDPSKGETDGVALQIQNQWKRRRPFEQAIVHATFYLGPKRRGDGDGMLTTLLDLLKDAGVIVDDNWRRVVRCGATCIPTDGEEHIEVRVEDFNERTVA